MKLKYVGKKERETAFSNETGITWHPGDSHTIDKKDLCDRMLKHPDVFAEVKDAQTKEPETQGLGSAAPAPAPAPAPAASVQMQGKDGPIDLAGLDAEQLRAIAAEYEVKVNWNTGAEKVTAALIDAFPVSAA